MNQLGNSAYKQFTHGPCPQPSKEVVEHINNRPEMYLEYLPTYLWIEHNPQAKAALKDDPAVQWMAQTTHNVKWVFAIIVFVLCLIGNSN